MIEPKTLDVEGFSNDKVALKYPNLVVNSINENLPCIVKLLEKGEMPLVATYKGQTKILCYISRSAFNVDKLLRTQGALTYRKSEGYEVKVETIIDYMEAY